MIQPGSRYPIDEVCRITGIQPARIQFIELEFKEFFGDRGAGYDSRQYEGREVMLLQAIHDLIFSQGKQPGAVREHLSRQRERLQIVAVTSGKGGVGKTTLSVNLAIAMAAEGLRTLVIDADLGLGNVHVFAGIAPRGTVSDLVTGNAALKDLIADGPGNVKVLCGASGSAALANAGPRVMDFVEREIQQLVGTFGLVLIDTGAGISEQVTRFLAMADDIVVVTTPNIAATLDAYGVIKVAREAGMRGQIHVVVNQADEEAEWRPVYDRISQCAMRFLQFAPASLGWLTRDRAFEQSNQARQPLLVSQPDHPNSRRIQCMAAALSAARRPDVRERVEVTPAEEPAASPAGMAA